MQNAVAVDVKVADEVWIGAALLHQENPNSEDFTIDEILDRVRRERVSEPLRKGVYAHIVQHCVANRPPSPGRYRMLFETSPGRRRLFRPGDTYNSQREGSKKEPQGEDLPAEYRSLLDWYHRWSNVPLKDRLNNDPLLALYGSGKRLWADEHADEYVRRLREGWE